MPVISEFLSLHPEIAIEAVLATYAAANAAFNDTHSEMTFVSPTPLATYAAANAAFDDTHSEMTFVSPTPLPGSTKMLQCGSSSTVTVTQIRARLKKAGHSAHAVVIANPGSIGTQ